VAAVPSGPSPPPTGSSSLARPPPRGSLSRFGLIVVVAVVVVLVVAALLLVGNLGGPGSSTGPAAEVSEQSAANAAAKYAAQVPGGPWNLTGAQGVESTANVSSPVAGLFGNTSCPLEGSTISELTVPGFNGTYSNGLAEAWLFVYVSTNGTGATLILFAEDGGVSEVGEITTPGCIVTPFHALPSDLIDSTAAARAAVATANGTAFVSEFAQANATYYLDYNTYGGLALGIPQWILNYDACSGGSTVEFDAEMDASNGTVVGNSIESYTGAGCGPVTLPLGTALSFGTPQGFSCPAGSGTAPGDTGGCTPADYTYSVPVASSSVGLDEFSLTVYSANGAPFDSSGFASFAVLGPGGQVIALAAIGPGGFEMNGGWTAYADGVGGGTLLTLADILVADMGQTTPTTGHNLLLGATGENGYTGTVSVGLP